MNGCLKAVCLEALRAVKASKTGWSPVSPVWRHEDGHFTDFVSRVEMIPGKWYHTDETWVEIYGPFDTEVEANAALNRYAASL